MSSSIEFYRLSDHFYNENTHLVEVMDKDKDTNIFKDKERGYGVLLVPIERNIFAIPLRSNMHINHQFNFTTRTHFENGKKVKHGLDYSKAIIANEDHYIDKSRIFLLEKKSDYVQIDDKQDHIIKIFTKYVSKYKDAVIKNDKRVLKKYEYSTLQNYHKELGLNK